MEKEEIISQLEATVSSKEELIAQLRADILKVNFKVLYLKFKLKVHYTLGKAEILSLRFIILRVNLKF